MPGVLSDRSIFVVQPEVDIATQAELDAAFAGKQPLDSDLTAVALLPTTAFGRTLLTEANVAALQTYIGLSMYTVVIGNGSSTSFGITHSLNTLDPSVTVRDTGSNQFVFPTIVVNSVNAVTLVFSSPPTSGQYSIKVRP